MLIFEVEDSQFVLKAQLDQFHQGMGEKFALACYGYCVNHLIWIGISGKSYGQIQIYDFDLRTEELMEHENKRVMHEEFKPCRIHRIGEEFFYTGSKQKVMKLVLIE